MMRLAVVFFGTVASSFDETSLLHTTVLADGALSGNSHMEPDDLQQSAADESAPCGLVFLVDLPDFSFPTIKQTVQSECMYWKYDSSLCDSLAAELFRHVDEDHNDIQ